MNPLIFPNTNPDLRAVLVLHDAEPEYFPIIAWRVCLDTGSNIPVLAGGLQIGANESLENWAITQSGSETLYPLDPGSLPTTIQAFIARNAKEQNG